MCNLIWVKRNFKAHSYIRSKSACSLSLSQEDFKSLDLVHQTSWSSCTAAQDFHIHFCSYMYVLRYVFAERKCYDFNPFNPASISSGLFDFWIWTCPLMQIRAFSLKSKTKWQTKIFFWEKKSHLIWMYTVCTGFFFFWSALLKGLIVTVLISQSTALLDIESLYNSHLPIAATFINSQQ